MVIRMYYPYEDSSLTRCQAQNLLEFLLPLGKISRVFLKHMKDPNADFPKIAKATKIETLWKSTKPTSSGDMSKLEPSIASIRSIRELVFYN